MGLVVAFKRHLASAMLVEIIRGTEASPWEPVKPAQATYNESRSYTGGLNMTPA